MEDSLLHCLGRAGLSKGYPESYPKVVKGLFKGYFHLSEGFLRFIERE